MFKPVPKGPRASRHAARSTVRAALGPLVFASILLMAPSAYAFDCACHSVKVMVDSCVNFAANPKYVMAEGIAGGNQHKRVELSKKKVGIIYKDKNGKYYQNRAVMPPDGTGTLTYIWSIACSNYKVKSQGTRRSSVQYQYRPPTIDFNADGSVNKYNPGTCQVFSPSFTSPEVKAIGAGNTNSKCPQDYKEVFGILKAKGWHAIQHEYK